MYYKQKYIKYKLKYLNLVGGEPQTINFGQYTRLKLYEENAEIKKLLKDPYSVDNYIQIKKIHDDNILPNRQAYIAKISFKNKTKIIRLLEEIINHILNLSENLKRLSLPPFNKKEKVMHIINIINGINLNINTDWLSIFKFSNILINVLEQISNFLLELFLDIVKDFRDLKQVELQDTLYYSLSHNAFVNNINDGSNKLIVLFYPFLSIYLSQGFVRIRMTLEELTKNLKSIKYENLIEEELKELDISICACEFVNKIYINYSNELNIIFLKIIEKKIIKYCSKIQQLLNRCGISKNELFLNKFKIFLLKLEEFKKNINTKEEKIVENELKDVFLELLDTIKGKLPTTKCVLFYGMDDVSKYDFYDLLKKIGTVLIELNYDFKQVIEQKIDEVKQFLSTSSRALSFVRKLKPTVESTEPVDKPENKIEKLNDELYNLIFNCIPTLSTFVINFKIFKSKLKTSNIRLNDIKNFDEVWKSVAKLEDSYKCSIGFSKKEFSKKELYTKLKEIGKLLLSNISELAEEIESVQLNVKSDAIQPKQSSDKKLFTKLKNIGKLLFPENVTPDAPDSQAISVVK
jgi:hypothetical protein